MTSPRESLERIARQHGLRVDFPAAVVGEAEDRVQRPGIDDPSLVDLESTPFVTIDGPETRDLDQALHIERDGEGFVVSYAIADASWFVRPGSALFAEALLRGASHYLPGWVIPMLPRGLSEGVISLNRGVARRALVFVMRLDATGACTGTKVVRARIRSREKLSFEAVSELYSGKPSPLAGSEIEPSLRALREVGELRKQRADEREVVRFRRTEIEIQERPGLGFVAVARVSNEAERHNEQVSLLANEQGARLLAKGDSPDDHVEPIYRVHPPPDRARIRALGELSRTVATRDPAFAALEWQPSEPLAEWLRRLPQSGRARRAALALERQALMTSGRSTFSSEAAGHFGVGADLYARFTAPMREIVGIFLHQELFEKLSGKGVRDEPLRQQVIESANRAKELDKRLTKASNELVLDALFERELARQPAERLGFSGTLVGSSADKLYVVLDEPAIEVKVYRRHLPSASRLPTLGEPVSVRVRGREHGGRRAWMLEV